MTRRYRDVYPAFHHTSGGTCVCQPSIETAGDGDVVVHRPTLDPPRHARHARGKPSIDAGYAAEQGESDL